MNGPGLRIDRREAAAALAPAVLMALVLLSALGLWAATLEPAERSAWWALLEPRVALVFLLWLVISIAAGTWLRRQWLRHAASPSSCRCCWPPTPIECCPPPKAAPAARPWRSP
jgi:hypothetical protein